MKKSPWILFVLVITLFAFISLIAPGYFPMHDDLQIGRLYQLDKCFRDGQFPCRWVPDMGYGYGYPLFNYYPPLPYLLGEIFHLLGASFIWSIKLVFIFGFLMAAIFAYLLGKELWGIYGGLVVAAFYTFAPYHAVDVYVRGALSEFWGLAFFPAVFWAVYRIIKARDRKGRLVALLALFYGCLLLSHNLMALFFTPAIVLWGLFLIWYLKKSWQSIWPLAFGGIWGVGLAAFFTLPVLFERQFVHIETMFIGYFNYLAHFANLKQLFFSRFWGYGPSVWGAEDGMAFPVGQLHWLIALLSFLLFVWTWLKKRKRVFWLISFFIFHFSFFIFLTHLRSSFIWERVPVLASMQFPWRFLAPAGFFVSLLAGSIFTLIKKEKIASGLAMVMIFTVVALNLPFFHPEMPLFITDKEKLLSKRGWLKLQTDAIFDYLPIYVERPPGGPAPDKPWFEEGEGEIGGYQKGTDWQEFSANVISDRAVIRLPLYDFPKWRVWVDGQTISFNHDNELGLITFKIPPGEHQIKAKLTNTPIRCVSNLISLISWMGLAGLAVKKKKLT